MQKLKKFAAVFLSVMMLAAVPVFAEPEATPAPEKETASAEVYLENPNLTAPDTSHAEAVLLADMKTGRTILSKNSAKKMYPASTTKMMTAILALESNKMGDTVTASYEALKSITLEDSHMGILVGEELTMTDLINGMLVYSANDAANVIAIHIGGSMDAFVDLMNAKATELGMNNTKFKNACGVHHDEHYTTAEDLAILARYCMKNEKFREIVKKPSYHIDPTNKYVHNRDLPATNLFLGTSRSANHVFENCTGIKTGTTEAAGHCLVSSAEYEGMELVSVVLKCDDEDYKEKAYSYTISRALFDFGFNNYKSDALASPGTIVEDKAVYGAKKDKRVSITVASDVLALVPIGDDISKEVERKVEYDAKLLKGDRLDSPIKKGQTLGTVTYSYHGKPIATAPIIAANAVDQDFIKYYSFSAWDSIKTKPLLLLPVFLIIIAIIFSVMSSRSKKRSMERRRKLREIRERRAAEEGGTNIYAQKRAMRNAEFNRTSSKSSTSRYSSDSKD